MKLMAATLEGNKTGIPKDGVIIVPGKVIDKSNVDAFTANLKKMMGK
jgi:ribose transport system substrate-binding protein